LRGNAARRSSTGKGRRRLAIKARREKSMEKDKDIPQIPYIVYESAEARSERTIKRLIIALIISVILIFGSNAIWLYEWTQYDYVTTDKETETDTTYTQDGGGINNINTGAQGDVTNGPDIQKDNPDKNQDTSKD
jgi:hypothetical protein